MKEVFNKKKIIEFIDNLCFINIKNCSVEDIISRNIFKKIDLDKIDNIGLVFKYIKSDDDKKEFFKKFFPNRYEELIQNGDFNINYFAYSHQDEKIHCIVVQDSNERRFMLKTDNYSGRIPDEIAKAKIEFKKEVDKCYGYWFEGTPECFYITDKNKSNGDYRKVVSFNRSICDHVVVTSNYWIGIKSYKDLIF